MKLEHIRRKKLKAMDETHRLIEEDRLVDSQQPALMVVGYFRRKKMADQMKQHESLLHPGGRKQVEEVWKKQDGLVDEDFDPKVFFFMHGKGATPWRSSPCSCRH